MQNNFNNNAVGGQLLCSGDLKDFNAVGELGQSVYKVAYALREAIRRNSPNAENLHYFLAIPQENEVARTVDWYADPSLGGENSIVINWNQASAQEQLQARQKLFEFKQSIDTLSQELQEKTTDEKGDIYTFSKLLPKVLRTPCLLIGKQSIDAWKSPQTPGVSQVNSGSQATDGPKSTGGSQANIELQTIQIEPSFIYLVGPQRQPVLAFWGFTNPKALSEQHPFHFLNHTPAPVQPTPVQSPVNNTLGANPPITIVTKKKFDWWRWLRWLLLALLLAFLLLFGLRSCTNISLPFFNGSLSAPSLNTPSLNLPSANLDAPRKFLGFNLPNWLPKFGFGGKSGGLDAANGSLPSSNNQPSANDQLPANNMLPNDGDNALLDESNIPVDGDGLTADESLADKDMPPVDDSLAEPPVLDPNAQDQGSQTAPPTPTLGPELQMPPKIAAGTPKFLNGKWNIHGLQDQKSGRPVSLEYDLQDGVGTVKVNQSNGVSCSGSVNANVGSNSDLNVGSHGNAACEDGSSYEMPEIKCQQNANQETECFGVYDEQQFPVSMRQSN